MGFRYRGSGGSGGFKETDDWLLPDWKVNLRDLIDMEPGSAASWSWMRNLRRRMDPDYREPGNECARLTPPQGGIALPSSNPRVTRDGICWPCFRGDYLEDSRPRDACCGKPAACAICNDKGYLQP